MGWDFKSDNNDSKKAEFTKLPEGITRLRVVGSEPHVRWTHWVNSLRKSVNCAGRDCAICEVNKRQKANGETPTYGGGRRFSIWVINRETGKLEILEQGVTFFEDLRDLMEELVDDGKTLLDVDIKVKRKGKDTSTSYRLSVDDETPLTDKDKSLMEEMFDLNEYFRPATPDQTMAVVNGATWEEIMAMTKPEEESDIELK